MKTKTGLVLIGVALMTFVTPALATGQSFYQACGTGVGRFFNSASCEAMSANLAQEIMAAPHPDICLPRGFKPEQAVSAIEAYMARHPEGTARSENNIAYNALLETYPCASPPSGR